MKKIRRPLMWGLLALALVLGPSATSWAWGCCDRYFMVVDDIGGGRANVYLFDSDDGTLCGSVVWG